VHEFISTLQWLAVACVIAASVGATRTESRLAAPAPAPD
jgi:threonine/homoserine efflux transporter RhtA